MKSPFGHSIESLRTMSVAELKALIGELFPSAGHPWLEKFLIVINDPASGAFHHAMADERVHVLYCHDKEIGMCGSSQKSEKALCNRNN